MVPGETPHHPKSPDEPVTIDLTAERIIDAGSKEPEKTEPEETVAAEAEASTEPTEAVAEESETAQAALESETPVDDKAPEDLQEPAAVSPASTNEAEPVVPPYAPEPAAKKQSSTSGSIAAGIFGGLIALLGAGSIQYAGLIPNLGPTEKAAPAGPDYSADIAALKTQIADLAKAPSAAPDMSAVENRIAALESSVSTLASQPAANGATNPADDSAVKALGDRMAELETQLNLAKTGLAEAEKKLAAPKDEINVGKAIATSALKAAIDRGGPFASELETLANVAPADPVIAKLQPFAKAGVLSRAQLSKQMPTVADAILTQINQPAEGTGLTERLVRSALSMITVRPVGDVEGQGAAAIVARMEERLQNGDLKGSAEQWDTLPEPAKAVSKDFKAALDSRIAVEGLIGDAMSDAVAGSATKG